MSKANQIRDQINDVWQQAVTQLEEVKDALSRSAGRLEEDLVWLRSERDRLLKTLGEQTYRLANQGKLPMPAVVKRTVERLNEVIDSMVETQRKAKGGKKKTAKKATKKKTAKKKAAKKTTAKKTSKKKVG